jgi:hypothetical protein
LCHVLGVADYLAFEQVTTPAGQVICVLRCPASPSTPQQFTAGQLGMVVAAAGEVQDAAPMSPEGVVPGSEDWILRRADRGRRPGPSPRFPPRNPPILAEALFKTAFWLLNTMDGLLDLPGIARIVRVLLRARPEDLPTGPTTTPWV